MDTTKEALTERQLDALIFILNPYNRRGPSFREVAKHLGAEYVLPAQRVVKQLVERGYLKNVGVPGKPNYVATKKSASVIEAATPYLEPSE